MSFIVRKKINGNEYYYLNENKRVEGKVKTKTLAYLGKSRKDAEKKAGEFLNSKKQEKDIKNTKSSKRLKIYKKILSSYGVLTLFYGMLWYLLFDLGKMLRKTVPGQKKTELLSWKILSRR